MINLSTTSSSKTSSKKKKDFFCLIQTKEWNKTYQLVEKESSNKIIFFYKSESFIL